jgi:hypothetical protein
MRDEASFITIKIGITMKRIWASSAGFYCVILVATAFVFLWQQHLSPVLDRDGVTYLQSAAGFLEKGWQGVIELGEQATWPFYSIFIALFSKLTFLPISLAAQVLNFIFVLITVVSFVQIVKLIGGDLTTRYFALLAILCWHGLTRYFPDVLRDHGFNAFLLLSVILFYHYLRAYQWRYLMAWWFCIAIAFLFRLEAIVYVLLLPLAVGCQASSSGKNRFLGMIQLYCVPFLLLLFVMLSGYDLFSGHLRFEYIYQQITQIFSEIALHWQQHTDQLAQTVFPNVDYVFFGLFASAVAIFICLLLETLGVLNVVALLYVFKCRKECLAHTEWRFVVSYAAVAWLIMALFFLEYFFLSHRYVVQFGLFVAMIAPFALRHAYRRWSSGSGHMRVGVVILSCAVIYNIIASLFHFGHENHVAMVQMGRWMKDNLPANVKVVTNAKRISYYASRDHHLGFNDALDNTIIISSPAELLSNKNWLCSDYVVFVGNRRAFDDVFQTLKQRHWLLGKPKQYVASVDYAAVIAKVNPLMCQHPG